MTTLPTRQLGRSGLELTVVGLGCNNFGRPGTFTETQAGTTAVLEAAIDAGVTFFDTADMYGGHPGMSEEYMGVALRGRRDSVILATKFGHSAIDLGLADGAPKGSRTYIRAAVAQSLRRLQTDYLDLYQLHTPDPGTPIEETIGALRELVAEGTIRSFGHSNFDASQLVEAEEVASETTGPRCESAQNELSLLARDAERDILPLVTKYGMGFLPYFPLYNGLFTGKFGRTTRPADSRIARQRPHLADEAPWDTIEAFEEFCADHGTGMLAATFAWLLSRDGVTSVIAGATGPEQVRQNADAALAWTPTEAELKEISRLFSDPS
jgi:aryl-alcohol dehydrogenase-like predicted oxidoreductase